MVCLLPCHMRQYVFILFLPFLCIHWFPPFLLLLLVCAPSCLHFISACAPSGSSIPSVFTLAYQFHHNSCSIRVRFLQTTFLVPVFIHHIHVHQFWNFSDSLGIISSLQLESTRKHILAEINNLGLKKI